MKKISKVVNQIIVAAVIALLTAFLIPGNSVSAQEDAASSYSSDGSNLDSLTRSAIDLNHPGTLNVVHWDADDQLAPGVTSRIYLVATVDENGKYTIADAFKGYFSDQEFFNNGFNYDQWKDCVAHTNEGGSNTGAMEQYIDSNNIKEVATGISNAQGETSYTGLTLGVYFVRSGQYVKGDYTHSFINFVYPVPILEKKSESADLFVNYAPTASPKKSKMFNGEEVHCSIQKQWNDGGYANRPASVIFEIYADGKLMETVTLSAANNWYYEWQDVGAHDYTVREIGIAEGYSSSISVYQVPGTHNFYYTCVNSRGGDTPPPPPDNPPPPPENPPTNPPTNPPSGGVLGAIRDLPQVLGAVRQLPQVLGARRLPQTGQLWWPLPILVIAGILFIVKGIKKNAKNKAQNN